MPHAVSSPSPGLQALILCGPGSSFPTFTANPDENPKALLPIANRPMVWYPIDFCYRSGITGTAHLPLSHSSARASRFPLPALGLICCPSAIFKNKNLCSRSTIGPAEALSSLPRHD